MTMICRARRAVGDNALNRIDISRRGRLVPRMVGCRRFYHPLHSQIHTFYCRSVNAGVIHLGGTLKFRLRTLLLGVAAVAILVAFVSQRYAGFSQQVDHVSSKSSLGDEGDSYVIQIYGNDIRPAVLMIVFHHTDTSRSGEYPPIDFVSSTPPTAPRLIVANSRVSLRHGTTILYLSTSGDARTINIRGDKQSEIIGDFRALKDFDRPGITRFVKKWYFTRTNGG